MTMQSTAVLTTAIKEPDAGSDKVPMKVVAATVAGNALEFYDFIAYAFFAVYIGKTFFPASDPLTSLLLSVGVFGVGFIFRPLGGVLIGAYADRAGRKPAMLLTIAMITVGTIGLALTPSYEAIGIAAPLIVVLCRLVQGLALGGEVGPATAFLVEIAPPGRRSFFTSWQLASQGIAGFTAGIIGLALAVLLSPEQLTDWGWRVPFLLCLLLVPIAIYLRREMPETLHEGSPAPRAATTELKRHSKTVILAVLIMIGATVSTYVGTYMTTYAIVTLKFPAHTGMAAIVVGGLATIGFALLGGWLADIYGRRVVMILPRIILALVTWPLFLLLADQPTMATLFILSAVLAGLSAMTGAATLTIIPELLPRSIRATGLSIAYAVGVALFGGTTQLVITYLISATGDPTSPAWYVTATSIVTLVAMLAMPESKDRALED